MPEENNFDLSHDDMAKVMATIDIPACPAVVAEAMREAQKDEPDLNRLAENITNDAGMSAAALKLANSPLYGASTPISSVRKAVDRLGTKNTVCVVVSVALRASMTGLPKNWVEQFWKRTSLVAIVSSLIARRQYGISPDAAYTYALFHDAAIPLMMRRFPEYAEIQEKCERENKMLVEAEKSYFPCSHPVIGSLLVRNWGLPPILSQAIRFHHEEDAYELPDRTLPGGALSFIAVTQLAERLLSDALGSKDMEVGEHLFSSALDYLGISENDLDELRLRITDAITSADD